MSGFANWKAYWVIGLRNSGVTGVVSDLSAMLRKVRFIVMHSGVAAHDAFVRLETYARKQEISSQEVFLMTAAMNLAATKPGTECACRWTT